ncbi:MAG: hypothetical protein V8S08_09475 [Lachnoclostridium sp.]
MPFCIKETDMKRKIRLILFVVEGQHVESISIRVGMRMCACVIAEESKIVRRDQSKFQRRNNGSNGKQLLKGFFVVKREVLIP